MYIRHTQWRVGDYLNQQSNGRHRLVFLTVQLDLVIMFR